MQKKISVALGTFDGLHIAHQKVLKKALLNVDYPIVITFNNIPKNITASLNEGLLLTINDKQKLLKKMGFKKIETLDFNQVKNIKAEDFLNDILAKYKPHKICCGYNYRFGKDALGDINLLKLFCKKNNIEFSPVKKVEINNTAVSSSYIRTLIKNGNVKLASVYLGRNFYFKGPVVHGDRRGRTIGFPTINQLYNKELLVPKFGVYKSSTIILGKRYKSITNIGIRPTFKSKDIIAETNIFNFTGSVYNKNATVELIDFIREEKKFNSLEELKEEILKDKQKAE